MNVPEIGKNVSLFPELIVVRMLHHLVPELDAKPELLLISIAEILQAAGVVIELVAVLSAVIEGLHVIVIGSRDRSWLAKAGEERKVLRQKQCSVVMIV